MGRRKIEIEPITHERNRSVTFLKRKNGLFKKAYELGVLCSVDVAVIIFEERPGHNVKLYQYCSGNVDEIVQRHSRYDGEKDTRNPNDFANNPNANVADGDDDDVEEDEPEPIVVKATAGAKKNGDTKPKNESGAKAKQPTNKTTVPPSDMDPLAYRPMTIPNPPIPIPSSNFSIPISGEIQNNGGPSIGPRIVHSMDVGHSPQDDMSSPGSGGSAYGYHPSSIPPSYRGPRYPPYYPISSPPQPYLPGSPFDYHPRSHYRPMTYPPPRPIPYPSHPDPQHYMRLTTQYHHQQQHGYPPMMYPPPQQPPPPQHPSDIFAAFLDDHPRQHSGPGFGPIDWPVHAPVQDGRSDSADPNDASWLDFLSNNPPPLNTSMHVSSPLPPGSGEGVSWEREREQPPDGNRMTMTVPSSRSPSSSNASRVGSGAGSPKRKSSKRPRVDSDMYDGLEKETGSDVEMQPPTSRKAAKRAMVEAGRESEDISGEEG